MSHSEILATFVKELLSQEIDSLNVNFYANILERIRKLKEAGNCDHECGMLLNTIRYMFLLRLEKEIAYIRRHGRKPEVELPAEEAKIIESITRILRGWEEFSQLFGGDREPERESSSVNDKGVREVIREGAERSTVFEGALVSFLKPHPKILYKGGSLGPFSKGDIAFIPRKIALELESKGYVELIE